MYGPDVRVDCPFKPVPPVLPLGALDCSVEGSLHLLVLIVTVLTPFSFSPMTDTSVGCLPELFLAYCTLADHPLSDSCPNTRAITDMMTDDPVPFLSIDF